MKTKSLCQKLAKYWELQAKKGVYGMYISNNAGDIPEPRLIQFLKMLTNVNNEIKPIEIELKKEGKL